MDLPGRLDPALVDRLNARGVAVRARTAAARPGRRPTDGGTVACPTPSEAGNAVLVGGLGLLEVVLLVGPAFAVGVRRRRRDLALVAVAGGDARAPAPGRARRRRGARRGRGGARAAARHRAAAFAGRPLVEQHLTGARSGGYRVFPAALAAIAAVAVLAGVLAALAPAWTAARQDVVAGLAGRRSPPPPPPPLAGRRGAAHRRRRAAVAALGAARTAPTMILAGLVLGELGLVFGTPTLVGLLARAGRLLPLAPRIALRDASRNRPPPRRPSPR